MHKRVRWKKTIVLQMALFLAVTASICLSGINALASSQPYITSHGINFGSGNKYQVETDVSISGPVNSLVFKRTYNSQGGDTGILGHGWTSSYGEHLVIDSSNTSLIVLVQPGGRHVHFKDNGNNAWINETGLVRTITKTASGYQLTEASGTVKTYDSAGKILSKQDLNNITQAYTYSGDLLSTVTNTFGKTLTFSYSNDRLTSIDTPVGTYTYAYDANDNLISVTKPDNTTRQYIYDDPNDAHNLTGIIDETGTRILTAAYDSNDRIISSEKADGADKHTIEYLEDYQRTITGCQGVTTTYQLEVMYGIIKVKSFTGPGCSSCGSDTGSSYVYNSRQQIEQVTDANGNITSYQYDSEGRKTTKTEAVGTASERTTTYTYDAATNKPATITTLAGSDNKTNTMTYDASGNLLQKTETGTAAGGEASRTTTYTYDSRGRITSIDGSRSDVTDVTTFAYYPDTENSGLNRGFLQSVTNALGHTTTYSDYNGYGRATVVTSPTGSVTSTYDAMGRLVSQNNNGIITSNTYDAAGRLTCYFPNFCHTFCQINGHKKAITLWWFAELKWSFGEISGASIVNFAVA